MKFGQKVQELRQVVGLSQPGLAAASGLPVGTIRDYEQERRMPSLENAVKLAAALGVDCRAFAECVEKPRATVKPVTPTPGNKPPGKPGKRERLEGGAKAVNDVGQPTRGRRRRI